MFQADCLREMLAPVWVFSQRFHKVSSGRLSHRESRVGAELREGFAGIMAEELFAPFHADVDQPDCRFDVAARERQALLAAPFPASPPRSPRPGRPPQSAECTPGTHDFRNWN